MKYPELYREAIRNRISNLATSILGYKDYPPIQFFDQVASHIESLNNLIQEAKRIEED
jgi:hypothetical protein